MWSGGKEGKQGSFSKVEDLHTVGITAFGWVLVLAVRMHTQVVVPNTELLAEMSVTQKCL